MIFDESSQWPVWKFLSVYDESRYLLSYAASVYNIRDYDFYITSLIARGGIVLL